MSGHTAHRLTASHELSSELQPLRAEAAVFVNQPHHGGRLGRAGGLGGDAVQLQLQLPAKLVEIILSQLGGNRNISKEIQ